MPPPVWGALGVSCCALAFWRSALCAGKLAYSRQASPLLTAGVSRAVAAVVWQPYRCPVRLFAESDSPMVSCPSISKGLCCSFCRLDLQCSFAFMQVP